MVAAKILAFVGFAAVRMLFRFLSARHVVSVVLGVRTDPHRRRLAGTSCARATSLVIAASAVWATHVGVEFRGRYRAGKSPEPEPVSDGCIAYRPGIRAFKTSGSLLLPGGVWCDGR
jgi:hypothetical protein